MGDFVFEKVTRYGVGRVKNPKNLDCVMLL